MNKLFKQLERTYPSVRNKVLFARTSFLNYYYVIYKLLELLNQNELMQKVPMLTTNIRLKHHDILWGYICDELDWPFKPTKTKISKH
jgi:hypothetical protein